MTRAKKVLKLTLPMEIMIVAGVDQLPTTIEKILPYWKFLK